MASRRLNRVAFLITFLALALSLASASAIQVNEERPAVAVVTASGLLLPVAAWSGSEWTHLSWPVQESLDDEKPPGLPPTIASIPTNWFAPLASFPADWRLQLLNGGSRPLRLIRPAPWSPGGLEGVAIQVDYHSGRSEGYDPDIGIAVSGKEAAAHQVKKFSRSSVEWRSIVNRHMDDFDRAQKFPWAPAAVRTRAGLRQLLLGGVVDLWKISLSGRSYYYFEVSDDLEKLRGPCLPAQAFEGRLEVSKTGAVRVLNIQPVRMSCGDMNEVLEVMGAVTFRGATRIVIKSSGDDWQSYKLADPGASLTWRQY